MAEQKEKSSAVKLLLTGVVIFVAASGGVYLGGQFNKNIDVAAEHEIDVFTGLKLLPGVEFPQVELFGTHYDKHLSRDVLNEKGTIVLFMEAGCSPCHSMAIDWKKMIEEGLIDREQVVGISFTEAEQVKELLSGYDVSFPVYADEQFVFMNQYGVDAFPLMLVVGKSGIIRYSDYDYRKKFDADELQELLSL